MFIIFLSATSGLFVAGGPVTPVTHCHRCLLAAEASVRPGQRTKSVGPELIPSHKAADNTTTRSQV